MSFAFMPFYTGDYRRDTSHLTPTKHGVYLLLLMHCWDQKGPVPLDEQEAAGICNCRSADEIESLRYILGKYFVRMEDGWYNRRMQAEVERAENLSESRSRAGRAGYEARAKQLPARPQASAKQLPADSQAIAKQVHLPPPPHSPPPPPPEKPKETGVASSRGTRLSAVSAPPEWVAWAKDYFPGINAQRVFAVFRDHWIAQPGQKGVKTDWFATWRNWVRRDAPSKGKTDDLVASLANDPRFKDMEP
jgi:uncharacterized protein YdaU (DUF1376 family)